MRAVWRFEGHSRKGREMWLDHTGTAVRPVNLSGVLPAQDRWYTVEYMTTRVDDKPERVVLNAVWEEE